jgi:hypothetical protein
VDPVPDPLLLRNRTRTSGSVAKISDHYTTEAVLYFQHTYYEQRPDVAVM